MLNEYFFQLIDLPPLPDHFVQEALAGPRTELLVTSRDRMINDQGNHYRNATLHRWKLSEAIADWMRTQAVHGFVDVSVQSIGAGTTLGPHTDSTQRCKLFYNLVPGGSCVETIWYREQGESLIRDKFLLIDDTSRLVEIYRCVIAPRQWGFINVGVIHEVKGLTSVRETVVTSFEEYIDISPFLATDRCHLQEKIHLHGKPL